MNETYGLDYSTDQIMNLCTSAARIAIDNILREREQLTARVNKLEYEKETYIQRSDMYEKRLDRRHKLLESTQCELAQLKEISAKLEQQLKDEKGICEALRSQNSDAVEEVQKLEQQIQQAEKVGYYLGYYACEMDDYKEREENTTYEQAIAERDGGAV